MRRSLAIATLSSCRLIGATGVGVIGAPLLAGASTAEGSPESAPGAARLRDHARHVFRAGMDAAAATLGLSTAALRVELRAGHTAGQIADEAGVSRADLAEAITSASDERRAASVAAGRMTQAEADTRRTELREKITAGLDRVRGAGRTPRVPDGPRHPRRGHARGAGPAQA